MVQFNAVSKLANLVVDHNKTVESLLFVSTPVGVVNLFAKFFVVPLLSNETILESKYFTHIASKSYKEIFGSLVILIGNIYVYCNYERLQQEALDNQKEMFKKAIEKNPSLIKKAKDHILDDLIKENNPWIDLLEVNKALIYLNNTPTLITNIKNENKLQEILAKSPKLINEMTDFVLIQKLVNKKPALINAFGEDKDETVEKLVTENLFLLKALTDPNRIEMLIDNDSSRINQLNPDQAIVQINKDHDLIKSVQKNPLSQILQKDSSLINKIKDSEQLQQQIKAKPEFINGLTDDGKVAKLVEEDTSLLNNINNLDRLKKLIESKPELINDPKLTETTVIKVLNLLPKLINKIENKETYVNQIEGLINSLEDFDIVYTLIEKKLELIKQIKDLGTIEKLIIKNKTWIENLNVFSLTELTKKKSIDINELKTEQLVKVVGQDGQLINQIKSEESILNCLLKINAVLIDYLQLETIEKNIQGYRPYFYGLSFEKIKKLVNTCDKKLINELSKSDIKKLIDEDSTLMKELDEEKLSEFIKENPEYVRYVENHDFLINLFLGDDKPSSFYYDNKPYLSYLSPAQKRNQELIRRCFANDIDVKEDPSLTYNPDFILFLAKDSKAFKYYFKKKGRYFEAMFKHLMMRDPSIFDLIDITECYTLDSNFFKEFFKKSPQAAIYLKSYRDWVIKNKVSYCMLISPKICKYVDKDILCSEDILEKIQMIKNSKDFRVWKYIPSKILMEKEFLEIFKSLDLKSKGEVMLQLLGRDLEDQYHLEQTEINQLIEQDARFLALSPYQNDKLYVEKFFEKQNSLIDQSQVLLAAHSSLLNNKEFVVGEWRKNSELALHVLAKKPELLGHFCDEKDNKLAENKEFLKKYLEVSSKSPNLKILDYIHEDVLQQVPSIFKELVAKKPEMIAACCAFKTKLKKFKLEDDFILSLALENPEAISFIPAEMLESEDFLFKLLKHESLRHKLYARFEKDVNLAVDVCWRSHSLFRKLIQHYPKFFRVAIRCLDSVKDYYSEEITSSIVPPKESVNHFIQRLLEPRPNTLFKIFSEKELSDKKFVKAVAVNFPEVMLHVPEALRKDQDFIADIISSTAGTDEKSKYLILLYVDSSVRNSKKFIDRISSEDKDNVTYSYYSSITKQNFAPYLFAGEKCVDEYTAYQLIDEYKKSPNKYRYVGFEFVRKAVRSDKNFLKDNPKLLCTWDGGQSLANLKWEMKENAKNLLTTVAPQNIRFVHALQFLDPEDAIKWATNEVFKKDLKK